MLFRNLLNSCNITFNCQQWIERSLVRGPIEYIDKRPVSKPNPFRKEDSIALEALQGPQIEPVSKVTEQPLPLRRSNDKMV